MLPAPPTLLIKSSSRTGLVPHPPSCTKGGSPERGSDLHQSLPQSDDGRSSLGASGHLGQASVCATVPPKTPVRLDHKQVFEQWETVRANAMIIAMLEAYPGPALILNDRRQIVAANQAFLTACGHTGEEVVVAQRPGEAMGCVEAIKGHDGCGSAAACAQCGAGHNFQRFEQGHREPIHTECLITREASGQLSSFEFAAGLSRLPGGWTLLALNDISHEKRREVLERCFFHDVLNSAAGLQGIATLLELEGRDSTGLLGPAAQALVEELQHHRTLSAAESGTLQVSLATVDLAALAHEVAGVIQRSPEGSGRRLQIQANGSWLCDRVLLRRVLLNLLKNACEASAAGDIIRMTCEAHKHGALLTVENPGEMNPQARLQVFRRSFTTKGGSGHGIGTWSVKLITERYLNGQVSFSSDDGRVTFRVYLPAGGQS
ncbi:MAG: sensor histidine kinase [Planctomycetota bacterium]|nr:MAG: sensor histidine kinase [Planctomycetota bacterium]